MKSLSLLVLVAVGGCSLWYDLEPVGDMAGDLRSDDGSVTDLADLSALDEATPDLKPECVTSATCPSDKPLCETSEGRCRACVSGAADDAECAAREASTPFCGSSGACVECLQSMQCGTGKPVCSSSGSCGACSSAADDAVCLARDAAKGHCEFSAGPNLGRCVACTSSAQCAPAAPVCELVATDATRNVCRGCTNHDECASKVCNPSGACELADNIIYVNNRTPDNTAVCSGTTHAGTLDDPYCQIGDGITNRGTKPVVRILGSSDAYKAVSITSGNATALRLVGPGSAAATPARIFELDVAGVVVSLGSGSLTVSVEGLVIGDATSTNTNKRGVACQGSGATVAMTLRDVMVQKAGAEGVFADTCTLTVDASTVSNNTGAGISASGGTLTVDASIINGNGSTGVTVGSSANYTITNNIVSSNGATAGAPGLSIGDTGSSGGIAFNTITKNGGLNSIEGGVVCPASGTNKLIQASIVVSNSTSGGTQFAGKCQLQNVVAGTDSFAGATMLAPTFQSATNYHLVAGDTMNLACCIDKLAAPGTPNADHDVDYTARPKGTGASPYDIGAHEVQ